MDAIAGLLIDVVQRVARTTSISRSFTKMASSSTDPSKHVVDFYFDYLSVSSAFGRVLWSKTDTFPCSCFSRLPTSRSINSETCIANFSPRMEQRSSLT